MGTAHVAHIARTLSKSISCSVQFLRDVSSARSRSFDTMPREVIKATWNRIQTRRKSLIKCSITLIKIPIRSCIHSRTCILTRLNSSLPLTRRSGIASFLVVIFLENDALHRAFVESIIALSAFITWAHSTANCDNLSVYKTVRRSCRKFDIVRLRLSGAWTRNFHESGRLSNQLTCSDCSSFAYTFETSTSREFRGFSHTFNVVLLMKFVCWPSWLVCLVAVWPASPLCMLKCLYDMYSGGIGCCSLLTASRCFFTLR